MPPGSLRCSSVEYRRNAPSWRLALFDSEDRVSASLRRAWLVLVLLAPYAGAAAAPIDRRAVVTRHDPVFTRVDYDAPLTVGNGGFAFTADITGLQTFSDVYYREGIPLETLSRWCWVTEGDSHRYALADADQTYTLADGRTQAFPTRTACAACDWLRKNPHDQPLGQLALDWTKDDGSPFLPADVGAPRQTLDLWRGILRSRYQLGGTLVEVTTAVDPGSDTVAVRVESRLVAAGRLRVRLAFPRGHDLGVKNTPPLDWSRPESHLSRLVEPRVVERVVGSTRYFVSSSRDLRRAGPHTFLIEGDPGSKALAFALTFSPRSGSVVATAPLVFESSAAWWEAFWQRAAALDLSGSTNPLASRLEERVVLSQYLTAVQMAGDVPPQESGLTCSTWFGKHHTEMLWWHAAHFALWGHPELLARNLSWYRGRLPEARALARSRGLRGARWAKMVGPEERESPGGNALIAWNQPNPVYLAELLYRVAPTPSTLAEYRDLVLETADALASMTRLDPKREQYVLGPPLWIAQEIHDPATSQNPSFELAYWRFALGVAQRWRERLGLGRDPHWDDVIARLSPLPEKDGRYVALESHPDTWDDVASRRDHPAMLMPLGFLPGGPEVSRATMGRTLDAVLSRWDWRTKIWGWDYPMIAMTATRLGRPDVAVDVLLRDGPNNVYTASGLCPQRGDTAADSTPSPAARKWEIAAYLPANGAFLSAVALMVSGWDGCMQKWPGFPDDGTWKVRAEGWRPLP
jgi:hypothetical protein